MMTEQELLSRSQFGCGSLDAELVMPALAEFLASNGFHDAARMLDFMAGDHERELESLRESIRDRGFTIEGLETRAHELETENRKLRREKLEKERA